MMHLLEVVCGRWDLKKVKKTGDVVRKVISEQEKYKGLSL